MTLTAIYGMAVLLACLWMFNWAGLKADCQYCGGKLRRHEDHCPFAGSGQ